MIRIVNNCYILTTPGSCYAFRINEVGLPEHLHYGAPLGWTADTPDQTIENDCDALAEKRVFEPGNAIAIDQEHKYINLEDLRLEASSVGKGDLRDPFVLLRFVDGSTTADFRFVSAEVKPGVKAPLEGLPSSHAEGGEADQLVMTLKDEPSGVNLSIR